MNSAESRKLANSQTLSQVATGLIIALAAFVAFALDKRELGALYWSLVGVGVFLLVASMVLGGRGIARISSPSGLFNFQAWTCLLGFIILGISIFALGKPLESGTTAAITGISVEVGTAKARLDALESSFKTNGGQIQSNNASILHLSKEVKQLNERLTQLEELQKAKARSGSIKASTAHRDREKPRSSPLPHHAAYGSVLRDSADQAESDSGEQRPK